MQTNTSWLITTAIVLTILYGGVSKAADDGGSACSIITPVEVPGIPPKTNKNKAAVATPALDATTNSYDPYTCAAAYGDSFCADFERCMSAYGFEACHKRFNR